MGVTVSTFVMATPNATSNSTAATASSCSSLCSSLTFPSDLDASPISCTPYAANSTITVTGGQADVSCASTLTPDIDLCRVVLSVTTSQESEVYIEVWLPDGESTWNGRTMSTDNSGVNGCVDFDDMVYVTGLGFAAIGDNGGHNSSSFDGSWFQGSNELVLDWAGRARHASVVAGKAVVKQFYGRAQSYAYYIGCSAGGWQGLISAQTYPDDFDGIIAGSSATDFNHLQAWSGRFVQLTGTSSSDPRFLTEDQWITVQSAIFEQCDEALDGVNDGILEDPTLCQFDTSVLSNSTYGLTDTQITTVYNVFTELYNTDGQLLFPALLYGSQVDAFRLGQLSGSVQAISEDWYKYAVLNDSTWDALDMNQSDYAAADDLDAYHGYVSGYDGDLSAFQSSGGKLIMYHGMADPLVSEGVAQRYYLKVASTLGINNDGMDEFLRLFRISGMSHCAVGGIAGAGAWMFGQSAEAAAASHSIISYLQDWVEDSIAPDTIVGTKFWYDEPSQGVEFERGHCKFPYRTTYAGGDSTLPGSWNCTYIEDWQECGVGALPRLCNDDGTFDN
ncbi:feruloyl esterase B-2 [Lecanosticta acicola]|uniref:Carboxylic ester hydrolase n=1 Tax=Lecanosticta acicola TaxID=111012 RepID=A0AAI9E9X0_9PEZI|nr:feruloyl esterase B-2 [Lecanosticta acicola]